VRHPDGQTSAHSGVPVNDDHHVHPVLLQRAVDPVVFWANLVKAKDDTGFVRADDTSDGTGSGSARMRLNTLSATTRPSRSNTT
jgi:hypothetical protein